MTPAIRRSAVIRAERILLRLPIGRRSLLILINALRALEQVVQGVRRAIILRRTQGCALRRGYGTRHCACEVALLRQADQLVLGVDVRLLEGGSAGGRGLGRLQQRIGIILLELRIGVDRGRSAREPATRIRKIQVARVRRLLVVNLAGIVVRQILVVLLVLILPTRTVVRVIDLVDRVVDLLLLSRIRRIGRIGSAISRSHS